MEVGHTKVVFFTKTTTRKWLKLHQSPPLLPKHVNDWQVAQWYSLLIDWLIDHDDGVRTRLWTAATSGPTVHPAGDTRAWGTMVEWYRQIKLLIRPRQISGDHESSSSKEEKRAKEMTNLALQNIIVHTFQAIFFTCRHGASGFSSPPKEVAMQIYRP
jgi:hypothetical protein